jgi:hypothetical protein
MASVTDVLVPRAGWLRSKRFDWTFVQGIAALALLSGLAALIRPELLPAIIAVDMWFLGYHHVIATFTRLSFDRGSLREYRFFVFVLPFIVFAATFALASLFGMWAIATTYLYWQWFHYTRQSWGISQIYRAKSGGLVSDSLLWSRLCLYLVPAWGILYRSFQEPETFLFSPVRVIPVPELLVNAAGAAAIATMIVWGYQRFRAWREGRLATAHTWYMLSHFAIFIVGYVLIEDITTGWLVINVWHNAQYVLFVWFFNANRFRNGTEPKVRFLSTLSQRGNVVKYFFVCLAISTGVYLSAYMITKDRLIAGIPLTILVYQSINFHHYIVDSFIWKIRKTPLRKTLDIGGA